MLFLADPRERAINVKFRSLCRAKSPGGTVYYSRHRPTVEVGGQWLVVGFSTHAIQRTAERVPAGPLSYASLGDIFGFFDQCLEFDVCELPHGQLGFTFWENCTPHSWMRATAKHVLGENFDGSALYSYRVGYCPAVVEDGFLKAKTLLYPGWLGTPEYELLRNSGLSWADKGDWFDLLDVMDGERLREDAPPLLKWFHEHGVPQVRPREARYASAFAK